jgi:hypothetical protein
MHDTLDALKLPRLSNKYFFESLSMNKKYSNKK